MTRRNKAWVTDMTYIRTWQGWLYLAVVMDLFSHKSWAGQPGRQFTVSFMLHLHRGSDASRQP